MGLNLIENKLLEQEMTLRPAGRLDAPQIKRLVRRACLNPTGLKWKRFVVVIHLKGKVVGCAQIKPHRDGSQELASLVVHPDFRGQGIARFIIQYLTKHHFGDLYLICRAALGGFYNQLGFSPIGESEMPVHFRRVSRAVSIFSFVRQNENMLLIMKHNPIDL